jgi:hypothetical protein
MGKLNNKKCMLVLAVAAALTTGIKAGAQSDLGAAPSGGLRGPQDIINQANARDAYGNPVGGAAPEAGSIKPFSGGPGGSYPPDPTGGGSFSPPPSGAYPGTPAGGGYTPSGANQPAPYSYSSKHHHHKNQVQPPATNGFTASAPGGVYPPGGAYPPSGAFAPGGAYPPGSAVDPNNPNMSGPPGATGSAPPHHSGNGSLAGAAIGVPDRAGKLGIGVTGKAAKEVLKAVF